MTHGLIMLPCFFFRGSSGVLHYLRSRARGDHDSHPPVLSVSVTWLPYQSLVVAKNLVVGAIRASWLWKKLGFGATDAKELLQGRGGPTLLSRKGLLSSLGFPKFRRFRVGPLNPPPKEQKGKQQQQSNPDTNTKQPTPSPSPSLSPPKKHLKKNCPPKNQKNMTKKDTHHIFVFLLLSFAFPPCQTAKKTLQHVIFGAGSRRPAATSPPRPPMQRSSWCWASRDPDESESLARERNDGATDRDEERSARSRRFFFFLFFCTSQGGGGPTLEGCGESILFGEGLSGKARDFLGFCRIGGHLFFLIPTRVRTLKFASTCSFRISKLKTDAASIRS